MLSLREAIGTVIDHNSIVDIWGPEKDEDGNIKRTWHGMGHNIPDTYLDSVNWRVCGILRDNPIDSDIVNIKILDTELKKATACGDVMEKPIRIHYEVKHWNSIVPERFDNKCNCIDIQDPHYLICSHIDDENVEHVLRLIPHDRVEYIERVEDNE